MEIIAPIHNTLKAAFYGYLNEISNDNRVGMHDKAKDLEYVIMIILNKCKGWKLESLRNPAFPAIDLYDDEQKISVQVKSKKITNTNIDDYLQTIEDNKETHLELASMKERWYFAPECSPDTRNYANGNNVIFLDRTDIFNLMIANPGNIRFFLDYFGVFEDIRKNKGCHFLCEVLEDKSMFEFLHDPDLLVDELPGKESFIENLETKNLYLEADAGRGKTVLGYKIGKQFLEMGWEVLYIDLKEVESKNFRISDLGKTGFSHMLLIVDNCHLNFEIVPEFEKLSDNTKGLRVLFLSRYFFDDYLGEKYVPDSKTVNAIISASVHQPESNKKRNINNIIGKNNPNLRLLSILLKSQNDKSTINRISSYTDFYKRYSRKITDVLKREIILWKLDEVALASIDETTFSSIPDQDVGDLSGFFNDGLLAKKEDKYSFPHSQDAIAFLMGRHKNNFLEKFIRPVFEQCQTHPADAALLHLFNTLIYNFIPDNKTNLDKALNDRIISFLNDWKTWVNGNPKEAEQFFSSELINLSAYYFYGKLYEVMNETEIISHFSLFCLNQRDLLIKSHFHLNNLMVISGFLVGNNYGLVDLLALTNDEKELLYSVPAKYGRIRSYVNRTRVKTGRENQVSEEMEDFLILEKFNNRNKPFLINNKTIMYFSRYYDREFEIDESINISRLANRLKYLNDSGNIPEIFFEKAIRLFISQIKQIIQKSLISSISIFVNQIKKFNLDEYRKIIEMEDLKNRITQHFTSDFSYNAIICLDNFFYSEVDYLKKIYDGWIPHVSQYNIHKYLTTRTEEINRHGIEVTEKYLYTLIKNRKI